MNKTAKAPKESKLKKPRSIGMTDRLWSMLENMAQEKTEQIGERVSVSRVVADASVEYIARHRPAASMVMPEPNEHRGG